MKPIMKFAAVMALSIGMLPQANALITLKSNGLGDALLFPVFWGFPNVDNYFTISNRSNRWIQAHIRFRNGTWCGELLDFDVIFSPGDVLVFRIADIDGDGYWEIDQSLDPKNFQYSGLLETETDHMTCGTESQICMNPKEDLVPEQTATLNEGLINHARSMGHIEVIAEGVFDGMTHSLMERLIDADQKGKLAAEGQRRVGNKLGTSLWSWTDAANGFATSRKASDVGNWLSGTAFITVAGSGMGVSYNAEALRNFRTRHHQHRIDNYPHDSAVIIHDENSIGQVGGPSPFGDYLYGFDYPDREDRHDDARISFQTTWGPTLADGDDYAPNNCSFDPLNRETDNWDQTWGGSNSICEVETALAAGGQFYTSFFFAGEAYNSKTLKSYYFSFFPTKVFYGGSGNLYGQSSLTGYIERAVDVLVRLGKPIYQEIWDHQEQPGIAVEPPPPDAPDCVVSPCIVTEDPPPPPAPKMVLAQCVSVYTIDFIKQFNENATNFTKGKVILGCYEDFGKACNISNNPFGNVKLYPTWPFLGYTFEMDKTPKVGQWRSMQQH